MDLFNETIVDKFCFSLVSLTEEWIMIVETPTMILEIAATISVSHAYAAAVAPSVVIIFAALAATRASWLTVMALVSRVRSGGRIGTSNLSVTCDTHTVRATVQCSARVICNFLAFGITAQISSLTIAFADATYRVFWTRHVPTSLWSRWGYAFAEFMNVTTFAEAISITAKRVFWANFSGTHIRRLTW